MPLAAGDTVNRVTAVHTVVVLFEWLPATVRTHPVLCSGCVTVLQEVDPSLDKKMLEEQRKCASLYPGAAPAESLSLPL